MLLYIDVSYIFQVISQDRWHIVTRKSIQVLELLAGTGPFLKCSTHRISTKKTPGRPRFRHKTSLTIADCCLKIGPRTSSVQNSCVREGSAHLFWGVGDGGNARRRGRRLAFERGGGEVFERAGNGDRALLRPRRLLLSRCCGLPAGGSRCLPVLPGRWNLSRLNIHDNVSQ